MCYDLYRKRSNLKNALRISFHAEGTEKRRTLRVISNDISCGDNSYSVDRSATPRTLYEIVNQICKNTSVLKL